MKKLFLGIAAVVVLVVGCFLLRQYLVKSYEDSASSIQANVTGEQAESAAKGRRDYDKPVDIGHPAMQWFAETFINREPFLGFTGILSDDGMEDLIIMFHEDGRTDICWMTVAMARQGGGWDSIDPVRAPVENQKLRVFDMDGEPPLEYIVTGEKNGQVGYAIFRIIDGKLTNLFAEDMADCC
jgi:hypothetical protein